MGLNPALFLPQGMQGLYASDPRLAAAQQNLKDGGSMTPVRTSAEGIARALSGIVGGYEMGDVNNEYRDAGTKYNAATTDIFNKPDIGSMTAAAADAAKANPLVAPLAQQLALVNVEKGSDIRLKDTTARIAAQLMGDPNAGALPAGVAPSAPAPGAMPPAAPALDAGGINAPMSVSTAPLGAPSPAGTPPAAAPAAPVAPPIAPAGAPGAAPAPAVGANGMPVLSPRALAALALVNPAAATALKSVTEPDERTKAVGKEEAKEAAKAGTLNQEIQTKGGLALEAIQRLKAINPDTPSGSAAGADAWLSRNGASVGIGKGADATNYSEMQQLSALVKAMDLKPLFSGTGQIRVAELKMLDQIENLDPHMSVSERTQLVNNVENMIRNQLAGAQQRTENLNKPQGGILPVGAATPFKAAGAAAPAGGAPVAPAGVPKGAIDMLKANPSMAAAFEAKYGVKATDYLGQ